MSIVRIYNPLAKMLTQASQARRICFWPGCQKQAINSHLLQKKGILTLIAEHGQLYNLTTNFFTVKTSFEKIGINEALTYKGFCSTHDNSLFASIEQKAIDFSSYKSKILLNYRAILNNIRKTEISIDTSSRVYKHAILVNDLKLASHSLESISDEERKMGNLRQYEKALLESLDSEDDTFHFSSIKAPQLDVATSAVHQFETRSTIIKMDQIGLDAFKSSPIFIHFLPLKPHTLIIISCRKDALSKASSLIIEANTDPVKFVSDTLVKRIETWVCSPKLYFKSLKPQVQRIIKEYKKYPLFADSDEYISLNIFNKWF